MNLLKKSTTSRYIIEKAEDGLKITIKSRRNIGALLFFIIWFLLWSYMFISITSIWALGFFGMTLADKESQGSPLFIMLFCSFSMFLFFLLVIGIYGMFVFLREIAGIESVFINHKKLIIALQFFGWKREKEFSSEAANEIIIRNTKRTLYWHPFQKQYTYAFELRHDGKTQRFGFAVKEGEAKEILSVIRTLQLPTS